MVTIEAMGTQKDIAAPIIEQDADYVLAWKGNPGTLHQETIAYFDYLEKSSDRIVSGDNYYAMVRTVFKLNQLGVATV